MPRVVLFAVAALVLSAGAGCDKKLPSESTGVAAQKTNDPKAPGMMQPPGGGSGTLPKNLEKTK